MCMLLWDEPVIFVTMEMYMLLWDEPVISCNHGTDLYVYVNYRYVIQPSSMFAIPTRLNRWKQGRRPMPRSGSETELNKTNGSRDFGARDRTHSLSSQDTTSTPKFKIGSIK